MIRELAKLGVRVDMTLWPEYPLKDNFPHARLGVAMPATMHTKNWGERRVIRLAPVTVLVSAEYHVSQPHRPPTALFHNLDATVVVIFVKKMLAFIVANM